MNKIKAYTGHNEEDNIRYYNYFEIIEELPTHIKDLTELMADTKLNSWLYNDICIDIQKVTLESDQPTQEVYDYDYYIYKTVDVGDYHNEDNEDKNINDYIMEYPVAIKITDEE